ncbi:MAG TPA: serine/threonine-protein kinase [Longimicrobium sp.]|jgi:serine/threonine-protein kinase
MREETRDRWRRAMEVLDRVIDLPEAEQGERAAALCGGDAGLRAEVEALLRACGEAGDFLEEPAPRFAAALFEGGGEPAPLPPGTDVGPFRVVREVGRGGMGSVYLAERRDPELRQRVALKVLRDGFRTAYLLRRFLEERQILASLEHPSIARLLDGGVSSDGVPWFAMEYVEGEPLDRYCDRGRLSVEERIALFRQVCDAVQYAHRSLVVHRDLKPSNLLVTAAGQPKLLDFGIARLLAQGEAAPETALTRAGLRLMTPEYASPEQARGEPVTTASDVYALGVLLHLLLAGRLPRRGGAGADREPRPPSAAVLGASPGGGGEGEPGRAAAARGLSPERLARRLRGDLDAIVLKALRAEPEERYATAEQLAADLRRHLGGLPVAARADTRWYRVRKFVRRNRAAVAAAALAAVLLTGFSAVTAVQAERIAAERDRAREVESFLLDLFQRSDPYEGSGSLLTVREVLDSASAQLGAGMAERPAMRAELLLAVGKAYYGLGAYDRAVTLLDSSYAVLRELRGETHPDAVGVANLLASVLRVDGRYPAAEALYRRVLAARRQRYGDTHPEVARTLNGLALVLRMEGRPHEAEGLLREALATDRAHAESEPAGVPQTLNNLGHVLRDQGRLEEAEAAHREALAARRALWGPRHFEVSVSLSNLAGVLSDRGDHAGADTLYRQALELRLRLVGERHPDLASDRAGYALLLHRTGELRAAEALYRQALDVHRRVLPAGHPVTAATRTGLGLLLLDLGRAGEARPLLEAALAARRRVLPPGHWQVVETESALGACLSALGRHAEAEPLLLGAHAALRNGRGGHADQARAALRRVAEHYERAGRPELAARYRAELAPAPGRAVAKSGGTE